MEAETIEKVTVTIFLDITEAQWLKGLMQNPLNDVIPEKEERQDRIMRHKFWNALDQAGVELI